MNNLPLAHENAIAMLPVNAQLVCRAKYGTLKTTELPIKDAKKQISAMITAVYLDTSAADGNQQANIYLTEKVYDEMVTKYKHLSIGELQVVLNEGIRKEYGEYFGINIATISTWLKAYERSEYRKASLGYYNLQLQQQSEKKEPTPEEREAILQKGCKDAYIEFKHDKTLTPVYRVIYDYLKTKHKIEWSDGERTEIKAAAAQNYNAEMLRKKRDKEINANAFDAAIKSIQKGDTPPDYVLEMKKEALRRLFEKWVKEGKQEITF
jgi:hypothetical protein